MDEHVTVQPTMGCGWFAGDHALVALCASCLCHPFASYHPEWIQLGDVVRTKEMTAVIVVLLFAFLTSSG